MSTPWAITMVWGITFSPCLQPTHLLCSWAHELRKGHFPNRKQGSVSRKKKKEYYLQDGHERVDLWPGPWRVDEIRNAEIRVERRKWINTLLAHQSFYKISSLYIPLILSLITIILAMFLQGHTSNTFHSSTPLFHLCHKGSQQAMKLNHPKYQEVHWRLEVDSLGLTACVSATH